MDKGDIFTIIQKYLTEVPVLLVGTGGTIPHGLPSMSVLAVHLINSLDEKHKADIDWNTCRERLEEGIDLENSLTDLTISETLLNDITKYTWELINKKDLELFHKIVCFDEKIPLGKLLHRFYQAHSQCVNIITTNYDRVLEYACDQMGLPQTDLSKGLYIREQNQSAPCHKKMVNILKVHGSLDWFENDKSRLRAFPLQKSIFEGHKPKIIPPGSTKYESALKDPYRSMIHCADDIINNAQGFLCIGYGFNDIHIQERIIPAITKGVPIVVVTHSVTEKAASIICNNSDKHVIIQCDPDDATATEFIVNKNRFTIENTYWTINGLLEIIS